MQIVAQAGDITREDVDAIVNAANPAMLGGGGVDGAIHQAAGPALMAACRRVPADRLGVRCPTGQARITEAGRLPARFVIHTVGPVYRTDPDPAASLARAIRSCMDLAEAHELETLAFPAISCGAYGYPILDAARIHVATAREVARSLDQVRFVLFTRQTFEAFDAVVRGAA